MATHTSLLIFLLVSYTIASFKLCTSTRNHTAFCPEIEKQSLLNVKKSLKDPNKQLSSWNNGGVDCCNWKGVVCNHFTGHVHELHLNGINFQGKISPSLHNLKHLRFLDLSQNNFQQTIPSFLGSLTSIEYLNLSNAGFVGKIPQTIGNLSNLHALDLNAVSDDSSGNLLDVDSLQWLLGLSKLEHLNMNGVNLSKSFDWLQVINSLPSLLHLHFKSCNILLDYFNGDHHVNVVVLNATSLTFLDLSSNHIRSSGVLRWIFQLRNLLFLDLSYNSFEGPIQNVSNATKLEYIDLSVNHFNSSIPDWIYLCRELEYLSLLHNLLDGTISHSISNLTSLEILYLSQNQPSGKIPREITSNLCKIKELGLGYNELEGEISDSFGNMSECFLGALEFLSLQKNKLSGNLTHKFGEFRVLQYLILSYNSFSGEIPPSLGQVSSLLVLKLEFNKFIGNFPESFGKLFNLQLLYISHNMLEGVVSESSFANLTKLEVLFACTNRLSLNVSSNWIPPFQLSVLRLGTWNLGEGPRIPSWIETQRQNLYELDLSATGISGSVPIWLWGIQLLDLSHNNLHGNIPLVQNQYLYLNSNKFNGSLPRVGDAIEELNLSDNLLSGGVSDFFCSSENGTNTLKNLDLGLNRLSGELPDCWSKWQSLMFLSLGNNNISGRIPNSLGFLPELLSLNINDNRLSGQMPSSIENCKKLQKIDFSGNNLDGSLPPWMGASLLNLKILILRSNNLSGEIPLHTCHLNSLQILDLSGNRISGRIPLCVYNFTAMAMAMAATGTSGDAMSSVYSYSAATGAFADSAEVTTKGLDLQYGSSILPLVNLIDLSRNNLSGEIPEELTGLVELISLNVSANKLTGRIPGSVGNMKKLESLDLSRNRLWGRIPSSLSSLPALSRLNVSYNELTGRIPEGTQLSGFDASSYVGNDLCGIPVTRKCSDGGAKDDGDGDGDDDEEEEESGGSEIEWFYFYVLLSLGYGVGFSMVCTILVLKKSWRDACFGLVESMWD